MEHAARDPALYFIRTDDTDTGWNPVQGSPVMDRRRASCFQFLSRGETGTSRAQPATRMLSMSARAGIVHYDTSLATQATQDFNKWIAAWPIVMPPRILAAPRPANFSPSAINFSFCRFLRSISRREEFSDARTSLFR